MSDQQPQSGGETPYRTLLNEFKTRLIGDPAEGQKKSPTFSITINAKNQAQFVLYTNIEGDRGGGNVRAKATVHTVFLFLNTIKRAIAAPGAFSETFKNDDKVWMRDKWSERPMWIMDITIEREAGDNDIKLKVKTYNRPELVFYFRPSNFHQVVGGDGQLLSNRECADLYAEGYVEKVKSVMVPLLQDYQVRYYANPGKPTKDDSKSSLVVGSIANNPRLTVFTNVIGDEDNKGMIFGKIDTHTYYAMTQLLKKAADAQPGYRVGIKNFAPVERDKPWGEKQQESTAIVGKDNGGMVYLAIKDAVPTRPIIQFQLNIEPTWSVLVNGSAKSPQDISAEMARSDSELLTLAIGKHLVDHYTPPDMSQWAGKRNGNNQQRGNNGNQNRSYPNQNQRPQQQQSQPASQPAVQPPMDFDDSIPF